MPNRQLSSSELHELFAPLLDHVRAEIARLSGDDGELAWALRRKLYKELTYDERGKPAYRKQLKAKKRVEQEGLCLRCSNQLPERGAVLDRFEAMGGYTMENTRLLCPECDTEVQSSRGYA